MQTLRAHHKLPEGELQQDLTTAFDELSWRSDTSCFLRNAGNASVFNSCAGLNEHCLKLAAKGSAGDRVRGNSCSSMSEVEHLF